jgi:hypothetical protein
MVEVRRFRLDTAQVNTLEITEDILTGMLDTQNQRQLSTIRHGRCGKVVLVEHMEVM